MSADPYAGAWIRRVLYEPRDVVLDCSRTHPASTVVWLQAPTGEYIDIRCVVCEDSVPRAFCGMLELSERTTDAASPDGVARLTWRRLVDSAPQRCPGGVDSAVCRWIASHVLSEEGDGYLELWERVHQWDDTCSIAVNEWRAASSSNDIALCITVGPWTGSLRRALDAHVAELAYDNKLCVTVDFAKV